MDTLPFRGCGYGTEIFPAAAADDCLLARFSESGSSARWWRGQCGSSMSNIPAQIMSSDSRDGTLRCWWAMNMSMHRQCDEEVKERQMLPMPSRVYVPLVSLHVFRFLQAVSFHALSCIIQSRPAASHGTSQIR